jgi:hypothetical protein
MTTHTTHPADVNTDTGRQGGAAEVSATETLEHRSASRRAVVVWGVIVGLATAAAPVAFWWVPPVTVYSVGIAFIAAVYVGFAVADGRPLVIAVEAAVALAFVVVAASAIDRSPWIVVAGLAAHGVKDLWQHHTHFVANTQWWPPFCVTVDWVAALLVSVAVITGFPLS